VNVQAPPAPRPLATVTTVLVAAVLLFAVTRAAPALLAGVAPTHRFLAISGAELASALLIAEGSAAVLGGRRRAIGLALSADTAWRLLQGALIGAGAATVIVLTGASFGGFTISLAEPEVRAVGMIALDAAAVFAGAAFEELAFRVALTGPLALVFPRSVSMVLPAAVFGIAHASNAGASLLSTTNTVLAGLLLAIYVYAPRKGDVENGKKYPDIGLAVGFHFAWNFALGWVWGAPVSGYRANHRFLLAEPLDTTFSGGSYGPEATLFATAIFLGLAVLAVRGTGATASEPSPE
jgi:membrane protease YdiL (CAAX protease family)